MTVNSEIVLEYLSKYSKTPILTLAKVIYQANRTVFKDVEDVRSRIRYFRGQGTDQPKNKEFVQDLTYNYNPFKLPDSHADPFDLFEIADEKTLVLSDPHFPYQDNEAVTTAIQYGVDRQPDCILLNGDIIDFAPISRHEKDWRQRTVKQEFDAVREFLKQLRDTFPHARIVYKQGNHDERWEKWLTVKAPELLGCEEFELETLLRFGEYGIESVKDKRIVMVGKLPVLHGHELAGGGGINPARSTFLKTYSEALIAHVHKRSRNESKTLTGEYMETHSMGCLCGLYPKYMRINQWCHGFAYIEQDQAGNYELDNFKIVDGEIRK